VIHFILLPGSDLSGSPLACPFSLDDYDDDDTVIGGPRKQWQKDEENHGSLSVSKARYIAAFLCPVSESVT
jgi:hypothetical protein